MQNQFASIPLASDPLRGPLEQFVSEHTGRQWKVKEARDMAEFACHPAAILSDGSYSVFAKFSEVANGLEQFEVELSGLRLLSERSGVLIPTPIGIISVRGGGSILVLERVQEIGRTPRAWRQIGQALAHIHKIKWDRFGLETHGYFGPLYQDNTPTSDWPTFYAERSLRPGLKMAVDSGNLPSDLIPKLERLISYLPELCGPEVVPSLLHGDASQNNFISTEAGAVVIDPAVYFGHPEMDLAFIDYFQPVPEDVFDGYQEELPIDPGFWKRRHLWRIWGYLAAVTVEGPQHLGKLIEAIQSVVRCNG
ncbi:MAG: fructosamine kinase family protein [Anaerolineales bacterium]